MTSRWVALSTDTSSPSLLARNYSLAIGATALIGSLLLIHARNRASVGDFNQAPIYILIFGSGLTLFCLSSTALFHRTGLRPFNTLAFMVTLCMLGYQLVPTMEERVASNQRELDSLAQRVSGGESVSCPVEVGPFTISHVSASDQGVILEIGFGFMEELNLFRSKKPGKEPAEWNLNHLTGPWFLYVTD
jgi:hypothetical protein